MKATLIAILALALPASAFAQVVQLGTVGQSVQAGGIGIIIPASGGTPTPTPSGSPTPTPTATPTPSGVVPYGGIAPQTGSWHVKVDDEFTSDGSINTSIWNGGPGGPSGGYFPLCDPSGAAGNGGYDDWLGYAGLDSSSAECGQVYSYGGASNTVSSVGLAVQDTNSTSTAYFNDIWAGLQDYGIQSIKPGSFVEWKAQMPHDMSGEGDGLHPDLWCTSNDRTNLTSGGVEVDMAEKVTGTSSANHETVIASIFDDGSTNLLGDDHYISAPGSPDLTVAPHIYGLYLGTGGGSAGQVSFYVDGQLQAGPYDVNGSSWSGGLYCFAGWMQGSSPGGWNGGNGSTVDSSTQNNDPLIVQYFRYWTQG